MRDKQLAKLAEKVLAASHASEIVGDNDDGRKTRLKRAHLILHPDKYNTPLDRKLATQAFARLEELLASENHKKRSDFEVSSKRHTFAVRGFAYKGSAASLYHTTYQHNHAYERGLMKISRNPTNNDLLAAEAKTLMELGKSSSKRKIFVPTLDDSFIFRDKDKRIDRRTNVFRVEYDAFVSLATVRTMFPDGVPPRHAAWMWRRALSALDFIHKRGFVHGGVTPEHVLILPDEHGLMFCGFGSSVEIGEPIKVKPNKLYVAPEMAAKEGATPATDIYMLSKTMAFMMGSGIPSAFRAFISGTTYERPKTRPQDAGLLLAEFDRLIERMWGPRTYVPFKLPATV